jgi:hypothetical protein
MGRIRFGLVSCLAIWLIALGLPAARAEENARLHRPLVSLCGSQSKIVEAQFHRVEAAPAWKSVWLEHLTGSKKEPKGFVEMPAVEVDFERCMVVAVFEGKYFETQLRVVSLTESDRQIVLRLTGWFTPSTPFSKDAQPWGVFVLPKSPKVVVIQIDSRVAFDDPPRWITVAELKQGDHTVKKE